MFTATEKLLAFFLSVLAAIEYRICMLISRSRAEIRPRPNVAQEAGSIRSKLPLPTCQTARLETGGREWELNPPKTGSLPHTDLKSGRPTGDDSPPCASSPLSEPTSNRSKRAGLISTQIPLPQGHAAAIEEIEDLDRDFSAVGHVIAKLGGGKADIPGDGGQTRGDPNHFAYGRAQEEIVVCDLVGPTHAAGAFQNPPDVRLGAIRRRRNVAHSRRPEPLAPREQRRNDLPSRHVLGGQPYLV